MSNTETLKNNKAILENKITVLLDDFIKENGDCKINVSIDRYIISNDGKYSINNVKVDITI